MAIGEITFTSKEETLQLKNEVIKASYEAVCGTMGPDGKFELVINAGIPKVTKDGVSVAKALDFNEVRRNAIAKIISEPAIKTDQEVGDGTTTTIFMMTKLYEAFHRQLNFVNTRYLDMLINETVQYLAQLTIEGDLQDPQFRDMLMTTSNYEEEIVDHILTIYREHNTPNITLMERAALPADKIEFNKEVYLNGRYAKDIFVPRKTEGVIEFNNTAIVRVIIIDESLSTMTPEFIMKHGSVKSDNDSVMPVPLVIMARTFDPRVLDFLQTCCNNGAIITPYELTAAGSLASNTIRDLAEILDIPFYGSFDEAMKADIPLCGTPFNLTIDKVTMDPDNTAIKGRVEPILKELNERYEKFDIIARNSPVARNVLDRIGRLTGNNITIKVTGTVPSEARERYYRYEDAMKAARTGLIYGVIPGIGYGYVMAAKHLESRFEELAQTTEQKDLLRAYLRVLCEQYSHLTGNEIPLNGIEPKFLDLITGEVEDKPTKVFDNAAATRIALQGGWATAKTLAKLEHVMGSSITNYL